MRRILVLPVMAVALTLVVTVPVAADNHHQSTCPGLKQGVEWYRAKIARYMDDRGMPSPAFREHPTACERLAKVARQVRQRAAKERVQAQRWRDYQYNWSAWLPNKWQRIGACETGYGKRPGNWQHNSGAYQGAFGFANQSWDSFVGSADPKAGPYPSEAYLATPRQQYEVALAIYRRYGLSGWGCRGA